jgi:cytochrome c553
MTILKATIPTIVLLGAPLAVARGRSDVPATVTVYCSGCHGLRGEAQLSYVPRLAGMGASYLTSRFETYRTAARAPIDETFARFRIGRDPQPAGLAAPAIAEMIGVAYAVSDKGAKAAIDWYASQQPAQTKPHNSAVAEDGRRLYTNGLQEDGVRACQSCHGGSAQGTDTVPRLAGQNAVYLLGQLSLFRSGERRDQPMMDIARNLKDDQARAVARYLQLR